MRCFPIVFAILLSTIVSTNLFAEDPIFEAVDYSAPKTLLELAQSLGDSEAIKKQASELKGADDKETLANILTWAQALRYNGDLAYTWRNYDSVTKDKCYGGCADYAIACGALLQSSNIPTVWVKTMDVNWIRQFKKNGPPETWSGHVFLEVHIDGKWMLLDPGAFKLYDNYPTSSRILPGNRFAYHKGCDPKEMIMSLQWEPWKEQTTDYFTNVDESLLPVDESSTISVRKKCHMIANTPYYQLFSALLRETGQLPGKSFNMDYERLIPLIVGDTVLVQTHNGIPIVKSEILKEHFPGLPDGKLTGKIVDAGTTLIFVDVDLIAKQFSD